MVDHNDSQQWSILDPGISQIQSGKLELAHEMITRLLMSQQLSDSSLDSARRQLWTTVSGQEDLTGDLRKLAGDYRRARAQYLQRMFRNNSGFGVNAAYLNHVNDCARQVSSSTVIRLLDSEFYQSGYSHLRGAFEYGDMLGTLQDGYNKTRSLTETGNFGYCLIPFDKPQLTKLVYQFSKVFYGVVENFFLETFGSFPQLYIGHGAVTEVFQGENIDSYPGRHWHSDESPVSVIKGFFYLSSVHREAGATRFFSRSVSDQWMKEGFYSSTLETRQTWDSKVEKHLQQTGTEPLYMTGNPGDIFLFDPNLLHKATPPVMSPRIGLHLVFYTGATRQTLDEIYRALYAVIVSDGGTRDFPVNPKANDVQTLFSLVKMDHNIRG